MKKLLLIAIFAIGAFALWYYTKNPLSQKVLLQGQVFHVEVAITENQKELGLGNRSALAADAGMLFVYDHKEQYRFWMKGMHFPLDFVWLDGNKIVDLTRNVPAPRSVTDMPYVIAPMQAVDKILEVNAGVIDKLGLKVGDTVTFDQ
jgi:uncharacterized membrane protein (UPF0127 family)